MMEIFLSLLLKFTEPTFIKPFCNGGEIVKDFIIDSAADFLGDGIGQVADAISGAKIKNSFSMSENPHKKIEEIFRKHDARIERKLTRLHKLAGELMKKKNYDKKEQLQDLVAKLREYINEVQQLRIMNAKYLRALRYQKSAQEINNIAEYRNKIGKEIGVLYDILYNATETGIHNKLQYNVLRIKDILNHEKFIIDIVEDHYYKMEERAELNQRPELEIPHNIDKLSMPN